MTAELPSPKLAVTQPVLITGGAGFIGCNLADRLAAMGQHVLVFDSLVRPGTEANLAWLRQRHPRLVASVTADIRDPALEDAARQAQAVFHLAAQVAVTTSLIDPMTDFEVNLHATVRLLDMLRRRSTPTPLVFASTNKVYGDLADVPLVLDDGAYHPVDAELRARGINEDRPLDFHTPYGCSKGAADQYVLDYGRCFDLPTCVMRMSCIYGQRQLGTEDQGWVAHFLLRALRHDAITVFGDGCQVRDILDVSDAVDAYIAAWRQIGLIRGRAYNLGGGPANAVSLRQVLDEIGAILGRPVRVIEADWRAGDQRYYVSDTTRIREALGLREPLSWRIGLTRLAEALTETHDFTRAMAS